MELYLDGRRCDGKARGKNRWTRSELVQFAVNKGISMTDLNKLSMDEICKKLKNKKHKLIGKGGHGCVFDPPYKCKDDDFSCEDCVGKTFVSIHEMETEYNLNKEVEKIDPTNKYHPKILKKCYSNKNKVSKDCGKRPYSPMLIYEKGVATLSDDIKNIKNREDYLTLLSNLINIFDGLKEFHKNGFYHFDIKPSNIIRNHHYKFIDFGLSETSSKFNKYDFYYKTIYYAWPPFIVLLSNANDREIVKYVNKYDKTIIRNVVNLKFDKAEYGKYLKDVKDKYSNSYIMENIDIYSLGLILNELQKKYSQYLTYQESFEFNTLILNMIDFKLENKLSIDEIIKKFNNLFKIK
jgi:serine/threonine protein kinase